MNLKDDKEYFDYRDFFKGEDFKNFHGINFISALVYNNKLFQESFDKFDKFENTCYLQSYIFLILGVHGNIFRIARPLVTWRASEQIRYDAWIRNKAQIENDFLGFVEYARVLGYVYDENEKIKLFNIPIYKKIIINFFKKYKIIKYAKMIYRLKRKIQCYFINIYKK